MSNNSFFLFKYMTAKDDFSKDLANIAMGMCVIKKEAVVLGDYDNIGIVVDGVLNNDS